MRRTHSCRRSPADRCVRPARSRRSPNLQHREQKLLDGEQVVGGTVFSPDPAMYCAMANAVSFSLDRDAAQPASLSGCGADDFRFRAGMPFVRVPDATESDIQKATDIGALGIIVPTVDTVEKTEAAVRWTKYPPMGGAARRRPVSRAVGETRVRQRQPDGGDHDRESERHGDRR